MRTSVVLLLLCFFSLPLPAADYGPTQVLNALRQLREQRGDPNPPKLAVCLKNSADGRWSDLQAHFYCWLKADQRACFTGAVDGEFKDHPELKGNYDGAFGHCQDAKGRAYGINFDKPLARLTLEQGEVFKNLLYRRPMFSKEEQRKILEAFYAGPVPERKPMPAPVVAAAAAAGPPPVVAPPVAAPSQVPAPPPAPVVTAPTAPAPTPMQLASAATMANPDVGEDDEVPQQTAGYPRSCIIKNPHVRTREKPDSNSPVVAILDPTPIKVLGPPQSSTGGDTLQWYPVEFHFRGKVTKAYLSVSLVVCPK